MVLPGCECGSVPIAGSLIRRGVTPAAALAFLLAAPAINPIVLTATAIAFPDNPEMVLARGVAGLAAALAMGWLWLRLGKADWIRLPPAPTSRTGPKGRAFWAAFRHDVMHAGGFLVLGAAAAATINVVVPERWLHGVAAQPVLSVLALAVLAVLLSICSEADAFVAASLSQFSLTARLVFLTVGPMVDLKLISMQAGVFGRRFAMPVRPDHVRDRDPRGCRRGRRCCCESPSRSCPEEATMNRQAQAVVMLLLGGAVMKASVTDVYLRYVRHGLRPLLIVAGVAAGRRRGHDALVRVARAGRAREPTATRDEGHGHAHREPRVAWLLILPVLALLLVAPPALGSYTAGQAGSVADRAEFGLDYAPLPPGDPRRSACSTTRPGPSSTRAGP